MFQCNSDQGRVQLTVRSQNGLPKKSTRGCLCPCNCQTAWLTRYLLVQNYIWIVKIQHRLKASCVKTNFMQFFIQSKVVEYKLWVKTRMQEQHAQLAWSQILMYNICLSIIHISQTLFTEHAHSYPIFCMHFGLLQSTTHVENTSISLCGEGLWI